MNARLYSAKLGVFTSTDPLFADMHRWGGLNAYGYAYGSPYAVVDIGGMAGRSTEDFRIPYEMPELTDEYMGGYSFNGLPEIRVDFTRYQTSDTVNSNVNRLPSGDIQKIVNTIQKTIDGMTSSGERSSISFINNIGRNVESLIRGGDIVAYDPTKWWHHLECYEQVEKVNGALERLKNSGSLEGVWYFNEVNNYYQFLGLGIGHTKGEASSDSSNPVIEYDPFYGTYNVIYY